MMNINFYCPLNMPRSSLEADIDMGYDLADKLWLL